MKIPSLPGRFAAALAAALLAALPALAADAATGDDALARLFEEWRAFENPPVLDGAPDYTAATFERRRAALEPLRARLEALDTAGWPIEARVDQALVRAEMNGFDFYARVLQ